MCSSVLLVSVLLFCAGCEAWQSCSKRVDPVVCEPCGEGETNGYKCPRQCGNELSPEQCNVVCSDFCAGAECEYNSTGSLVCVQGCVDQHTGPYCQQTCPGGCLKCTLAEGRCLECPTGRYGESCFESCNGCKGSRCDIYGNCRQGCEVGFYGIQCIDRCDMCKPCVDDSSCVPCDAQGVCVHGCADGYYGSRCDRKCRARCAQCDLDTGACLKCDPGMFGKRCKQECENCKTNECDIETGKCIDGCMGGYKPQGNICTAIVSPPKEAKDPEQKKAISGLASIFGEEDYMLPVVGCLVVLCAAVVLVIVWRCRKIRAKATGKGDEEDGNKCNGVNTHPPVRRNSSIHIPSASPYMEIVEEAIRTHSCEEILKKHNLLDPDRHRLSPTENKSLASLRNRTGNLSMPFMTPIEEDEEDEDVDVEDDGVHMPNVGIIFTLEPPSDDDMAENQGSAISSKTGSPEKESHLKESDMPRNRVSGDRLGDKDIYILQAGPHNNTGGRAVSFDCLDTSHSSGMSTPRVPDMYMDHPHESHGQFSVMLSDHLDTFLNDRPSPGQDINEDADASEMDTLFKKDNNQNVSKSQTSVPIGLKQRNNANTMQMQNGDTAVELGEVSFSEKDRMLSHTSDISA